MPEYDFECPECGNTTPLYHSLKAELIVKCPVCKVEMTRLIGKINAIHIKGSRFVGGNNGRRKRKKWKYRNVQKDGFADTALDDH